MTPHHSPDPLGCAAVALLAGVVAAGAVLMMLVTFSA